MASGVEGLKPVAVAEDRYRLWGVEVNDYEINGVAYDFESVIVALTTGRARTIESQIEPLSSLSRKRNSYLTKLGNALSDLTNVQASFKDSDQGNTTSSVALSNPTVTLLRDLNSNLGKTNLTKAETEEAIQLVKTQMEKLNNDSQSDMNRLQSLVSKRDESFSTASTIMSAISDTRSNTIKGIS